MQGILATKCPFNKRLSSPFLLEKNPCKSENTLFCVCMHCALYMVVFLMLITTAYVLRWMTVCSFPLRIFKMSRNWWNLFLLWHNHGEIPPPSAKLLVPVICWFCNRTHCTYVSDGKAYFSLHVSSSFSHNFSQIPVKPQYIFTFL